LKKCDVTLGKPQIRRINQILDDQGTIKSKLYANSHTVFTHVDLTTRFRTKSLYKRIFVLSSSRNI